MVTAAAWWAWQSSLIRLGSNLSYLAFDLPFSAVGWVYFRIYLLPTYLGHLWGHDVASQQAWSLGCLFQHGRAF